MTTPRHVRSAEAARKLRAIATAIESEPHRYDQSFYASIPETTPTEPLQPGDDHWCDSAFCIAGWNYVLHHWGPEDALVAAPYGCDGKFGCSITSAIVDDFDRLNDIGRVDLGLTRREAEMLFNGEWAPRRELTVGEALRLIADGVHVEHVSDPELVEFVL